MRLWISRFVIIVDRMLIRYYIEDAQVGFWHIPRECSRLADRLAKSAASSL